MSAHQMLFAKISFSGFSETFTSGTTTVSIPPGAAQVQVQAWGGGGGGGLTRFSKGCQVNTGGGGGSGAYVRKTLTIPSANWGNNISYSVGTAGNGGSLPSPSTPGGNTSVSSGTFTIPTTIAAPGGLLGTDGLPGTGGSGGSPASGGDCGFNINGNAGTTGGLCAPTSPGGAARTSPPGTTPSSSGGAGGNGGTAPTAGVNNGQPGGTGLVIFTWS